MYCRECGEKVDDQEAHDAINDHAFVEAVPEEVAGLETEPEAEAEEDKLGLEAWWENLPWIVRYPIAPILLVGMLLFSLVHAMIRVLIPLLLGILFLLLLLWAAIKLPWITDWKQTIRLHKYTRKKYRAASS